MANLTVTLNGIRKNDGDYLTTEQVIGINDTFATKFTVKNTSSSSSYRYAAILYEWWYEGTVVGSKYVFGKGISGSYTNGSGISKISEGGSATWTDVGGNVTAADMGMGPSSKADKLRIFVSCWISSESTSPKGTGYVDIPLVTFQGEAHYPTITQFLVRRNGSDSPQLKLKASGTRTLPDEVTVDDNVTFEVNVNSTGWTNVSENDAITVSQLLAGVDKTMNFTLPIDSRAVFRLTFSNDLGESSIMTSSVSMAFANVHLAGYNSGGVAFGQYSTSTQDNPKFECNFPSSLYGGYDYNTEEETRVGTTIDGSPVYRKIFWWKKAEENDGVNSAGNGPEIPYSGYTTIGYLGVENFNIMKIEGTVKTNAAKPLGWYYNTSDRIACEIANDTGLIRLYVYSTAASYPKSYQLLIYYTKSDETA